MSSTTTTERLEPRPAARAAFEAGEVSWAKVRLLVAVAGAETERMWLELARGRTVRALVALIRAAGRSDVHEEEDGDGEPSVRFRLRCPRRGARLWLETVVLARPMAGGRPNQGQGAGAKRGRGAAGGGPGAGGVAEA